MDDVTGEVTDRPMDDRGNRNPARSGDAPGAEGPFVHTDRRSILVSHIPEGINRDKLEIHFMRKTNGGGDIENVTLMESSTAKITYSEESFVQGVLEREQYVLGKKVEVQKWRPKPDDTVKRSGDPEQQKDSHELVQVFGSVRAFVRPEKSRYITKSWKNTVKRGIDGIVFKKGEEGRNEVVEVVGNWSEVTRVRSLLQIEVWSAQGIIPGTDAHGGSGSKDVDTSSAGTGQGRGRGTPDTPVPAITATQQPGSGLATAVRPKKRPHVTHQHGREQPGPPDEADGPDTHHPGTTQPQRHSDRKRRTPGQPTQIHDGPDGGLGASTTSHGYKTVNRKTQTSHDDIDPSKIVIVPDIKSYLCQVNGSEVLKIMLKNKAVIVMNDVDGQTEVEFFGSHAADSDPENAKEEFTTLYQKIHHSIVCKPFELQSRHIPPDQVSTAVAKIKEDFPRVMLKPCPEKDVMFYGTEKEVQEAKTAMCEHLGISTARGRRRRGATGTTGQPDKFGQTGTGSSSTTEWFNHTTREGIQIVVAQGDITKQRVDVIANAANESLSHGSGVAGAISKAGGPSIQKESNAYVKKHGPLWVTGTAVTGGGQLPCKHIIHAVGPRWTPGYEGANERELRQTCCNVLTKASVTLQAESVAIPAISSGIFGMPKDRCAESLLSGLQQFLQRASHSCTLRKILFIDMDQATVKVLADTFGKELSPTTTDAAAPPGDVIQPPSDQYSSARTTSRKSLTAPGDTGKGMTSDGADCSICMSGITDPKSLPCKHTFCRECIDTALSYKSQCPICNAIVGELIGNQPPGRMEWCTSHGTRLPGYENFSAIVISYDFPDGIQGRYLQTCLSTQQRRGKGAGPAPEEGL
ncbi:PREDICTED: uncharacterized protein LOC109486806 isoform X2 [Branchiostoma belcheri]|uniref:E3 ubiquitin-protein ligase n=1 Tax=Branchiostoma belcheri TaxID=7741 RepID=A0A6P5A9J0_BRABE|nr:PREDICTED: uncharacterized protein LOC109486806 isoform X2 [Branchiostoma belcheri]